jgi:Putative prokaryotic signal transducing protein
MLKVLTAASNPVEQSLLLARLSDAGIPCMRGAGGARGVLGSGRDILVEEEDLAWAQEILKEDDEGFNEEELTCLSEEAGRHAVEEVPPLPEPALEDRAGPPTPVEAQAPAKTHRLLKAFAKPTGDKYEANNPFGR